VIFDREGRQHKRANAFRGRDGRFLSSTTLPNCGGGVANTIPILEEGIFSRDAIAA